MHAKALRAFRSRKNAAPQAAGPLVKPFLTKRGVLHRTKVQVFEALALSRYLFNAHTWGPVLLAQLEEWSAGLRPLLFSLARPFLTGRAVAFEVHILCGICNLLAPVDMLHIARLRYFKRLLSHCNII